MIDEAGVSSMKLEDVDEARASWMKLELICIQLCQGAVSVGCTDKPCIVDSVPDHMVVVAFQKLAAFIPVVVQEPGAIGAGATVGTGVALIPGTLDIATRIFTCCSFVKCKKDPFSWVILLTPSLNCFWRNAGVQSMNLLFNCISSFISVLR